MRKVAVAYLSHYLEVKHGADLSEKSQLEAAGRRSTQFPDRVPPRNNHRWACILLTGWLDDAGISVRCAPWTNSAKCSAQRVNQEDGNPRDERAQYEITAAMTRYGLSTCPNGTSPKQRLTVTVAVIWDRVPPRPAATLSAMAWLTVIARCKLLSSTAASAAPPRSDARMAKIKNRLDGMVILTVRRIGQSFRPTSQIVERTAP